VKFNKNIIYYLPVIIIFISLKFSFSFANNNDLFFLLKPTNKLISIATNSNLRYTQKNGFYHKKFNITIDKSCSGYNFLLLSFLMLSFLFIKYIKKNRVKLFILLPLFIFTYFFTIFANVSRILTSLLIERNILKYFDKKITWFHQTEGIFIYLFLLISIYLVFEYILKKMTNKNEKSIKS